MSQPYIGEIRLLGCNFPPNGWAFCQGQLLPISQYDTLFNLIGTTYGGDGQSTFALPDLRGRVPIHQGTGGGATYVQGQTGGVETVTLTTQQIASHTHPVSCESVGGNATAPTGGYLAGSALNLYSTTSTGTTAAMLSANTGGLPHDNFQPYLVMNYSISLFGIFPSRN